MQLQQKQVSDVGVTDKLSKLSVRDEADGNSEHQSDHPANKKTKSSSRSRRRKKGRRGDAAAAVNGGGTCEFVQGGGGRMHSSTDPRRDWFTVDAGDKHTGPRDNVSYVDGSRVGDKARRDSIDRRKLMPAPAVEGSSKLDKSSSGTVTSQAKESRSVRSAARVFDANLSTGGRKSSLASKELTGNRRQVGTQRNATSASAAEVQSNKAMSVTESG